MITSSWDETLKCWDPRGASYQEHTRVGTYTQPAPLLELFSSSNCWMTCECLWLAKHVSFPTEGIFLDV